MWTLLTREGEREGDAAGFKCANILPNPNWTGLWIQLFQKMQTWSINIKKKLSEYEGFVEWDY